MTLKYESEILFNLMKRDGDDAPSDVLPYESEVKEKYLNQVVGAYPKLQDYRPEWLYYNLYHHLPSDFPVESVANVTSASFHNVVPYAYGSAILKGNTKYRDIDTGDILDTFDETKNLELVSVKMPVLTTTGKNLFDKTIKHIYVDGNGVISYPNGAYGFEWQVVKPNTSYVLSYNVDNNSYKRNEISYYSKDKVYIKTEAKPLGLFTTPNNAHYIVTRLTITNEPSNIQLEEGAVATSYEPYKSNILSASEDVELRGIGGVKDELDCLTGEVIERISELVLDGSEDWVVSAYNNTFYTTLNNLVHKEDYLNSISCDKFVTHTHQSDLINSTSPNGISAYADWTDEYPNENWLYIKYTDSEGSVDKLKQWLSQNPITVQYELATESIKTVDLSCINEQGKSATFRPIEGTMYVNTSSQTLPPLLDMSVPVEATTQNLMSFANIVGEE